MNTHATFRQTDVKRAIKAVVDAGLPVGIVEITRDGTIRILTESEKTVAREPEPDL